ncbi:Chromosomal replication initiator protein DnaA [Streptococcus sp. DD10]|uniref:chromosomal replication initiator protein DnaA n=1 Tax=Streptococcus sp. DD10 TaxID=1777878 RepID=UPI00079B5DE3|nr:chromosomal replication initiator protein DnaA [Streptococcus sp. DD10]KXT74230.1 Chromosomal replication initiator protein DnaA [Streptococcus sp. DD10]
MSQQDKQFWSRILELAEEKILKKQNQQAAFEFFVSDAQLIKVEGDTATIFLDNESKALYWDRNLGDIVLTAGFEIYGRQILAHYIFEKIEAVYEVQSSNHSIETTSNKKAPVQTEQTGLKSKYTLDNFVQGPGNQWAKAAALAVSENPGGSYNPLFIYGGPGLGKTHLINAIGNEIQTNFPQARIKYVSADSFINEWIESLRLHTTDLFKETYRNLDLLLIDDIQAIRKKESTQEEFFNTFNALYADNKQIVLTSDRTPDQLEGLEERLVTRFKWGLTQDITPPDFETRIAILRNKIQEFALHFPNETIEYLAGQFDSNVRELEGALKDINLLASFQNIKEITIEVAAQAIRSRKQDATLVKIIPIERIQSEVGNFYGVSIKEMQGSRRLQHIVQARQIAMYLARELTDNSLPKIGRAFGGKDHTTVIHAHTKVKSALKNDENLAREIDAIKAKIK